MTVLDADKIVALGDELLGFHRTEHGLCLFVIIYSTEGQPLAKMYHITSQSELVSMTWLKGIRRGLQDMAKTHGLPEPDFVSLRIFRELGGKLEIEP